MTFLRVINSLKGYLWKEYVIGQWNGIERVREVQDQKLLLVESNIQSMWNYGMLSLWSTGFIFDRSINSFNILKYNQVLRNMIFCKHFFKENVQSKTNLTCDFQMEQH